MTPAARAPAIPEVPPFHGEWSGPNSPLANSSPVEAGVHWTSAGRGITLTGSAVAGLEAATSGPVRLESGALLLRGGFALEPVGLLATPSEVRRAFRGPDGRREERWFAALDHPVAFRDLDLPDTVAFEQSWQFRVVGSTLATAVGATGRAAIVAADPASTSGPRVLVAVDGGRLDSAAAEPGTAALRLTGSGPVRLMLITGADAADLQRTLEAVARRGFTGLRSQRMQHERLLREYASGLSTPAERLDTAFEWAKVRADETVRSTRSVAEAEALLAVGWRDAARELLKAGCRALAASWVAWTGEAVPEAGALAAAAPVVPAPGPAAASPDHAADLPPALLLRWVTESLWGIAADAPSGSVSLAPQLPPGWTRMALSRIRIGPSAIDCEVRARAGQLSARVRRAGGPPLTVTLAPAGIAARTISVDGVALGGGRARFEAVGEHEVVFERTS